MPRAERPARARAPRRRAAPAAPVARSPLEGWFADRGWEPFPFQREVWEAWGRGESGLIHAPTGTGKTYAAWGGAIEEWLTAHPEARPARRRADAAPLRLLWITPLRALAADTEAALRAPVEALGLPWSVESRTGDTSASRKKRQRARLPTALVTTPESLSLLLCRADAATLFDHLEGVVVDEWHELLSTKRGVQVELCLARLRRLRPGLRTWGLSATLGNLEVARAALLGLDPAGAPRAGRLVRGLLPKAVVIDSIIPEEMERFPWSGHLGIRMMDAVLAHLEQARSAIVFTNTRAQAEIWFQAILQGRPHWFEQVALHHGSLDRVLRDDVEDGLRTGRYRAVVATSSLDLGVDFSPVDCVIQIGSPKGCARLLQRAGRSGHQPGSISRIVCVPTHAFELVEVAAARSAIATGALEARDPVDRPLDLLAQHLVTLALGGGFTRADVLEELRSTRAYGGLEERELDWVLDFLVRGGDALRAYPEFARVRLEGERHVVTDRRVALRHRLNIGTIVADASIAVRLLRGGRLGSVEESFVARLKPGDTFTFGGRTLEFVRLRDLTAWVRPARKRSGLVPRWGGGRMPLSSELSAAVRARLEEARLGRFEGPEMAAVAPVLRLQAAWSRIPAPDELLIERFDDREGAHLFVFPFEGRLVHEGLSALFAYRLAQLGPITFTFACNDYGFELLSPVRAPLEEALAAGLLSTRHLLHDIVQSLNAAELARRQFREVARVAGLVFQGYPGAHKSLRQVQASTGLLYDVFARYDPGNLLLHQAQREVLERQLEASRIGRTLERIGRGRVHIEETGRPTPLAFPILVDRTREQVSSEKLADRVRRMTVALEREAARPSSR